MTIGRLMEGREASITTCHKDLSVSDAAAILAERRIGALPVLHNGTIVGIFSERDLVYKLAEFGPTVLQKTVGEVMTAPAVTVEPETEVLAALSLMTRRRLRHFPVVSEGRMVGFISIGDLVKYRIDKIQSEAEAMRRNYIQTA